VTVRRDRLVIVAFLVAATGASARPASAQQISLDGSIWSRFETRSIDGGIDASFTVMQTRVGATGVFSPLVRFHAQAQDVRVWGEETRASDASADRFDLHQGYLEVGRWGETPVWLRAGRQEYEVAFGRVLGTPAWSPTSRSYDGVRAAVPLSEGARLEVFGFQIAESESPANVDNEYLVGAWAEIGLGAARTIHLFGLHDRDDAAAETARTTIGAQFDGTTGPVTYRVEALVQSGTVDDLDVSDATLIAVFARTPVADGRGSVGIGFDRYGGTASPGAGETPGFSDLFGRNHRFLGFADLFDDPRANTGGRGLTDLNLRGTWRLVDDIDLRLDWHRFTLVDDVGFDTGTLATEIDVQVMGRFLDGLVVRAGGSWVGAEDPLVALGRTAGDQVFGYLQFGAGF
jgi:hypothetical protein